MKNDAYPDRTLHASEIEDAVPQKVVRGKAGNKSPYTVLGKTYHVMDDSRGFTQTGNASWYGKKFHGHKTSNGETYDMYGMTAAHKTLPIPTYVRVTNLDNKLSTVVRVNDRGPFHSDRIIDLSYAAATKLDYTNRGTARVRIEALEAGQNYQVAEAPAPAPSPAKNSSAVSASPSPAAGSAAAEDGQNYHLPSNTYLQVAAYGSRQSAENVRLRLSALTRHPVVISEATDLFRVRIGPITDNFDLLNLRELLIRRKFGMPRVVYD
jgi:rare lipoprotein A